MTTKAQQARYDSINAIIELFMPKAENYVLQTADCGKVSSAILRLLPLGRTDRWQKAVSQWAELVDEGGSEHLSWAILQGSVYAGHAAN